MIDRTYRVNGQPFVYFKSAHAFAHGAAHALRHTVHITACEERKRFIVASVAPDGTSNLALRATA